VISEPAWKTLLRERLGVYGGQLVGPSMSSGVIVFVRTSAPGKEQLVAWCFGHGSRWIRRWATSPRFGLLAALNALAGSMGSAAAVSVGVTGASLARQRREPVRPRPGRFSQPARHEAVAAAEITATASG
jgi:hypothetical protein